MLSAIAIELNIKKPSNHLLWKLFNPFTARKGDSNYRRNKQRLLSYSNEQNNKM